MIRLDRPLRVLGAKAPPGDVFLSTLLDGVNMGLLRDAVKDCSLAYVSSEDDVQNIMASLGGDPSPTLCPAPFVVFSVTLFRRDVFRKVGLFNEGMTQAEDRDICLRAYCKGFQSFYISTAAYDINRGRLSDVPVTTPLRQYLRGLHKSSHIRLHTLVPPEDRH